MLEFVPKISKMGTKMPFLFPKYRKTGENASGKQYISDFYGNRKRLHRLEMRMNCEQIKRACNKSKIRYRLDLITHQESLDAIFIYALQSVLRFRQGRKVLQWEDLFKKRCQVI